MSRNPTLNHKAGATFELACSLEFDDEAVDITGWDISAQVRDRLDNLIDTATVAITDAAAGEFTVEISDTSDWRPAAIYVMDILYVFNGTDMYSETVYIHVLAPVTQEEAS